MKKGQAAAERGGLRWRYRKNRFYGHQLERESELQEKNSSLSMKRSNRQESLQTAHDAAAIKWGKPERWTHLEDLRVLKSYLGSALLHRSQPVLVR